MTKHTPATRRAFNIVNSSKICSADGCSKHRRRSSRWCTNHEKHERLYGHPHAGVIPRATLRRHRETFDDFIRDHRDTPQVIAAVQVCQDLIDHGIPIDRVSKWRQSKYELYGVAGRIRALKDQLVEGREVLSAAGGVWLLSRYEPKVLPDDKRLEFRLGLETFKLRPTPHKVKLHGKGEKRDVVGGYPRLVVGQYLRRRLAVFMARVAQGIAETRQAVVDHEALLATKFDPILPATITTNNESTPA